MPQYDHHACPVVVLSPSDSPVVLPGVTCRSAGKRGYYGQASLDRQRAHLKLLLEYPQKFFLLNDSDSFCLSPELPAYLYEHAENTIWSNEVKEMRPHPSPYPKIALQPPYFLTRETIEKLLAVGPVEAHPITPFVDHMMLQLACEAGVVHRDYPDGRSFPAWMHGEFPETIELGHDFVHEPTAKGVDGARRMAAQVRNAGVIFVHSVKHPPVRDQLVEAYEHRRRRGIQRVKPAVAPPTPASSRPSGELSILVAFRDVDGSRTRLWDFVRERFERLLPEAEVIVGTDDGEDPFWKTLALNRAAEQASGEVLGIWDCDTWVDESRVREASAYIAAHPERWIRPWVTKIKQNARATDWILEQGKSWDGTVDRRRFGSPEHVNTYRFAPPLLMHREAWDLIGGADERFRGWSSEDEAMCRALQVFGYRPLTGQRGEAHHLHHTRRGRTGKDLWVGQESDQANRELGLRYRRARTVAAMRQLIDA